MEDFYGKNCVSQASKALPARLAIVASEERVVPSAPRETATTATQLGWSLDTENLGSEDRKQLKVQKFYD